MSDEVEIVDPKVVAEEECKPACVKYEDIYNQCAKRIEGQEGKHCTGYALDWWKCIDQCAAPKYFPKLK